MCIVRCSNLLMIQKFFRHIKDSSDSSIMQKDFDTIVEWANKWQTEFNINKCKSMHLGKTNVKEPYFMRGNILETVDQEKDLGIIISSDFKCSQQCLYAYNRANKVLGMI